MTSVFSFRHIIGHIFEIRLSLTQYYSGVGSARNLQQHVFSLTSIDSFLESFLHTLARLEHHRAKIRTPLPSIGSDHAKCDLSPRDHMTSALKSLHWLPVKQIIEFKHCLAVNGPAPIYASTTSLKQPHQCLAELPTALLAIMTLLSSELD